MGVAGCTTPSPALPPVPTATPVAARPTLPAPTPTPTAIPSPTTPPTALTSLTADCPAPPADYHLARSDTPTRIRAPSIGLDAPVLIMGWETYTDATGTPADRWVVPDCAAGWHRNSALPAPPTAVPPPPPEPQIVGGAVPTAGNLSIRTDWVEMGSHISDLWDGVGDVRFELLVGRPQRAGDSRRLQAPGQHTYPLRPGSRQELDGFSLTVNEVGYDEEIWLFFFAVDEDETNPLTDAMISQGMDQAVGVLEKALRQGGTGARTTPCTQTLLSSSSLPLPRWAWSGSRKRIFWGVQS